MPWFSSWFRRRPADQDALSPRAPRQRGYMLGGGEAEISRLDMQHFMFRWELGDDLLAPAAIPI